MRVCWENNSGDYPAWLFTSIIVDDQMIILMRVITLECNSLNSAYTPLCLGLKVATTDPTRKASKTASQCKRLLADESMLWTFLQDRAIPMTNNEAERAIRPYVIWRKNSFFSQSARGDQFHPVVLTLTETCKRLGLGVYGILRKVCEQGFRGEVIIVRLPLGQHAILAQAPRERFTRSVKLSRSKARYRLLLHLESYGVTYLLV